MEDAPEYLKQWQLDAPTAEDRVAGHQPTKKTTTAPSDERPNVFASVLGINQDEQDDF